MSLEAVAAWMKKAWDALRGMRGERCIVRIWEVFPDIARQIRQKHEQVGLYGHHDFVHAFRVGEVARQAAVKEWGDERLSHLAGLAGLCHNADYLLHKELGIGLRDVPRTSVVTLVTSWLQGTLDEGEVTLVVDSVLKHEGSNSSEDSRILVALMDGDRVVNLDTDLFPRSGQRYPDLPVVDYRHFLDDPVATYHNPKTVLRDIAFSRDWANPTSNFCVRTKLGKDMARRRVAVFQVIFDALKAQLAEEGMYPFPLRDAALFGLSQES